MVWGLLKWFLFKSYGEIQELEEENRVFNEIKKSELEKPLEKEIGVVTHALNGVVEINSTWVTYEDMLSIRVGSLVSFLKPKNPDSNVVSNVELLKNVKPETNFKHDQAYEGVICYLDNDKILLNPGSLILWRNDTEVTYRPELGDKVKLENYKGFLKLQPKECTIVSDEILEWDGKKGYLKNHTMISLEVCDACYVPRVGDKVITCVIPCAGNIYQSRSLNVAKIDSISNIYGNKKIEVKNIPVFTVPIGKEKLLEVNLKNISHKTLEIVHVKIIPDTPYVTFIENSVRIIEPAICVTYRILCRGDFKGWTQFKLEFKFKNFVYHKTVKYLTAEVNPDEKLLESDSYKPFTFINTVHKPNFLKVRPKPYPIPLYLLEICGNGDRDKLDCMSLIQKKLPELRHGLTANTYALFFHTLLFLEEISEIQAMEQLETVAPLVKRGEYYVFIFEEGTNYSYLCPGDNVLISNPWKDDNSESPIELKVFARKEHEIYLKFKDVFDVIGSRGTLFRMKFKNNRTCSIRTHHAIDCFLKKTDIRWLFPDTFRMDTYSNNRLKAHMRLPQPDHYFFEALDYEQKEAVNDIVFTSDNLDYPYLLFGPPGTGKTVTLVEATLQTMRHFPNSRILLAAPSNSAVDTFCVQIIAGGNLSTKDLLRMTSFNYSQLGQLPVDLLEYSARMSSSPDPTEMRTCDVENIGNFKIIAGTLSTLGIINCLGLKNGYFTHIFIDEAGQTTEPETLIPLASLKAGYTRVVLAGDPNQLGPVILSQIAKAYQLGESLMTRLMSYPIYSRCIEKESNSFKPKVATMLRKNYRSLPALVTLLSDLFYKHQLEAMLNEASQESKVLNDLKKTSFGSSGSSLLVIKVNGKEEFIRGDSNSYWNMMEAAKVSVIIMELYKVGLSPQQIGIITPYSLQVKKIRNCLTSLRVEPPKIGTVEEFQGSERDVIVISLVRTILDECRLSFISDPKRANVSLSRAKVMNIIVGNEYTLKMSYVWDQVLNRAKVIDSSTPEKTTFF